MSNRRILALISLATPLAWAGLIYIIFDLSPEGLAARALFFALLYVALLGAFALIAFFASFRLFTAKVARGNAVHAAQQGALVAAFVFAASLLQAARALSTFSAVILMATLAVAGFVTLRKQYGW